MQVHNIAVMKPAENLPMNLMQCNQNIHTPAAPVATVASISITWSSLMSFGRR